MQIINTQKPIQQLYIRVYPIYVQKSFACFNIFFFFFAKRHKICVCIRVFAQTVVRYFASQNNSLDAEIYSVGNSS